MAELLRRAVSTASIPRRAGLRMSCDPEEIV